MLKTLLVLCGALAVSVTGLNAQSHTAQSRTPMTAARGSTLASRPAAYRGGSHFGGGGYGYHHHHGNYGRFYYLGGIPYLYPYDYYGFGYPYSYGGFYGAGLGYGGGYPNGDGAYNGRVADGDNAGRNSGASLPEAVQRQLSKRGYYKGAVDGQFGPQSREALTRFQQKQGLKETGRIDEPTLQALGFTDQER